MNWLRELMFLLTRWLLQPVLWSVKPRIVPEDIAPLLDELRGKPVCYVLRQHNWSDRLVLERLCKLQGLPPVVAASDELPTVDRAGCLYLSVLEEAVAGGGIGQTLLNLMDTASAQSDYPLQLVPVSIFWGRDPGSETSLFKLLLGDAEHAGSFRKLLIMLAQGRNVLINIGQPLDYHQLRSRKRQPVDAIRMTERLLGFVFRRQKTASLGPSLLSRNQMIEAVLRRPAVKSAMLLESAEQDISSAEARKRARKMADEVAANFDVRTLRLLDILLSWVFVKLFTGIKIRFIDRLRKAANRYHLIYMPSHRSHLDYLLISYALYTQGLVPPHIAAGVNLNFWPVGGLLRRGGAFYIRRSFSGAQLYTAVFKAYLDVLLGHGYPVEFFPEGGRSRTGRLLPPKKGMLSMVVESFLQQPARAAALVPVYVGYDKLVESGSYVKELRGAGKRKESAGELLKARRIFKTSYGSPYVAFGEPVPLDEALSKCQPDWRRCWQQGDRDWLPRAIESIAVQHMQRINETVAINPIGLVATILLSSPQKAVAENELLEQIDRFLALLKLAPYSADMTLPEGSAREIFEQAARTAGLSRIEHAWGPIVTVTGNEAVLLTYYRNTVMHALALPSLLARFFRHNECVDEEQLVARSVALYPFVKRELFLSYSEADCEVKLRRLIEALQELGMLRRDGQGNLCRADIGSSGYAALVALGRVLRETVERYTMASLLLVDEVSERAATRAEIEQYAAQMVQRLAILSRRDAPEYFDKTLFSQYLDSLIGQGLLAVEESDGEQRLRADTRLSVLAEQWVTLLGWDVQQNMQQLIRAQSRGDLSGRGSGL